MRRGHMPLRTCAGCCATAPKASLLRIARTADGAIEADLSGRAPGRGGYVHPSPACIEAALATGGIARALRTVVSSEAASRLKQQLFDFQERM